MEKAKQQYNSAIKAKKEATIEFKNAVKDVEIASKEAKLANDKERNARAYAAIAEEQLNDIENIISDNLKDIKKNYKS